MSQWIINEASTVTVITNQAVDLLGFYSTASGSAFLPIDNTFTQDGERYSALHTFIASGQYTIKVVDNNKIIDDLYISVHVENRQDWTSQNNTALAEITNSVAALESQVSGLSALIVDLDTLLETVNTTTTDTNSSLTTVASDIAGRFTTVDSTLAQVQTNQSTNQSTTDAGLTQLSNQITAIDVSGGADLQPVLDELALLSGSLSNVQNAISTINLNVTAVETDVDSLGTQVNNLASAMSGLGVDPSVIADAVWRYTRG